MYICFYILLWRLRLRRRRLQLAQHPTKSWVLNQGYPDPDSFIALHMYYFSCVPFHHDLRTWIGGNNRMQHARSVHLKIFTHNFPKNCGAFNNNGDRDDHCLPGRLVLTLNLELGDWSPNDRAIPHRGASALEEGHSIRKGIRIARVVGHEKHPPTIRDRVTHG